LSAETLEILLQRKLRKS